MYLCAQAGQFAVIDDVLKALGQNDVEQKEKDEVLCILYSMKAEIAHV